MSGATTGGGVLAEDVCTGEGYKETSADRTKNDTVVAVVGDGPYRRQGVGRTEGSLLLRPTLPGPTPLVQTRIRSSHG